MVLSADTPTARAAKIGNATAERKKMPFGPTLDTPTRPIRRLRDALLTRVARSAAVSAHVLRLRCPTKEGVSNHHVQRELTSLRVGVPKPLRLPEGVLHDGLFIAIGNDVPGSALDEQADDPPAQFRFNAAGGESRVVGRHLEVLPPEYTGPASDVEHYGPHEPAIVIDAPDRS